MQKMQETQTEKTEEELRRHRCCFTGHRPEKMSASEEEVRRGLRREILRAIGEGYVTFLSGMAIKLHIVTY